VLISVPREIDRKNKEENREGSRGKTQKPRRYVRTRLHTVPVQQRMTSLYEDKGITIRTAITENRSPRGNRETEGTWRGGGVKGSYKIGEKCTSFLSLRPVRIAPRGGMGSDRKKQGMPDRPD